MEVQVLSPAHYDSTCRALHSNAEQDLKAGLSEGEGGGAAGRASWGEPVAKSSPRHTFPFNKRDFQILEVSC
jgi:hypothetical protein